MQYKNIHRIEKFKNIQEPRVENTLFKNNSRPNKIQEHSRTFKDFKDQWPPCQGQHTLSGTRWESNPGRGICIPH